MDAVRDLDDPLTMVHLFATLPAEKLHGIPPNVVQTSRRLALEWQVWCLLAASVSPACRAVPSHFGCCKPALGQRGSTTMHSKVKTGDQSHEMSGVLPQAAQKPCSPCLSM